MSELVDDVSGVHGRLRVVAFQLINRLDVTWIGSFLLPHVGDVSGTLFSNGHSFKILTGFKAELLAQSDPRMKNMAG